MQGLHRAVRKRVYTTALEQIGMEQNMSYNQAEAIENIRLSESPSASFSLSGNITVSREYDRLVFSAAKKEDPSPEDKMQSLAGRQQEGQERWHMEQMTFGQFETYRREADGRGAVYGAFQGVDPQELQIRTLAAGRQDKHRKRHQKDKRSVHRRESAQGLQRPDILAGTGQRCALDTAFGIFHLTAACAKRQIFRRFQGGRQKTDRVIVLEKL